VYLRERWAQPTLLNAGGGFETRLYVNGQGTCRGPKALSVSYRPPKIGLIRASQLWMQWTVPRPASWIPASAGMIRLVRTSGMGHPCNIRLRRRGPKALCVTQYSPFIKGGHRGIGLRWEVEVGTTRPTCRLRGHDEAWPSDERCASRASFASPVPPVAEVLTLSYPLPSRETDCVPGQGACRGPKALCVLQLSPFNKGGTRGIGGRTDC
jgi:hypothetical protein